MMRRRLTWLVVMDLAIVTVAGIAIALEVKIDRRLSTIETKVDTMQIPADAINDEIERLQARIVALEKKGAKADRAAKSKSLTK